MDGILQSYGIRLNDFRTTYHEDGNKRRIEITVPHPTEPTICGYILFKWGEDNLGVLEMCNFNARLIDYNFTSGGTTKAHDSNQAGQHGEGFKLAALVLRRKPYHASLRLVTSSSYVNFTLNEDKCLVARVSEIKESMIRSKRAKFAKLEKEGKPRPLEPQAWKDVCWQVGAERKTTELYGNTSKTLKIKLQDFRDWLNVTLHIKPPETTIRTRTGNLILDEALSGRLFLRGLRLSNSSASGRVLRYCYDLATGDTGRDRTAVLDKDEESIAITRIWETAIFAQGQDNHNSLLDRYYIMLNLDVAADVHLATQHMNEDFAQLIWDRLKDEAAATIPQGFYYCRDTKFDVS